jgi:hypothetical protein
MLIRFFDIMTRINKSSVVQFFKLDFIILDVTRCIVGVRFIADRKGNGACIPGAHEK